jgi:hypothetical protein
MLYEPILFGPELLSSRFFCMNGLSHKVNNVSKLREVEVEFNLISSRQDPGPEEGQYEMSIPT